MFCDESRAISPLLFSFRSLDVLFFYTLRTKACVHVCVLNIYDDDQLYQNVGKSIIKIDGSKNNGVRDKTNKIERGE